MTGSGLGAGFPLGLRQHHLGLDAGAGVNQVVAEEDLRGGSAGSAVLGHVVSTDVDCGGVPILKNLLNEERLSITQIAEMMNFKTLSYFSRYCKKQLGMSPQEYRKSLQPK